MQIIYKGTPYPIKPDQSVLDCLLEHGINIPYSCKSGVCCSCIMKGNPLALPHTAQAGLRDTLKEQGYFLACVCRPEQDLELFDSDALILQQCQVIKREFLNADVLRMCLSVPENFNFKAGQYICLVRDDGLTRSYSIASVPHNEQLELHIRLIPNGTMSLWIKNSLKNDDCISIKGPFGHCSYSATNNEQPLLLMGTGTGLAPLYGILKDAMLQKHRGPIVLFHGGKTPSSLYLTEELRELSKEKPQFQYRPCVLSEGTNDIIEIPMDHYVINNIPWLKSARIYLCGDPSFVTSMRKKLFIAGASSKEIYADAFLPSIR